MNYCLVNRFKDGTIPRISFNTIEEVSNKIIELYSSGISLNDIVSKYILISKYKQTIGMIARDVPLTIDVNILGSMLINHTKLQQGKIDRFIIALCDKLKYPYHEHNEIIRFVERWEFEHLFEDIKQGDTFKTESQSYIIQITKK